MDDRIIVLFDLRLKVVNILHFRVAGTTKTMAQAKMFLRQDINKDVENNIKDYCIACFATHESLKYIPITEKTTQEPQKIQIDFTESLPNNKNKRADTRYAL